MNALYLQEHVSHLSWDLPLSFIIYSEISFSLFSFFFLFVLPYLFLLFKTCLSKDTFRSSMYSYSWTYKSTNHFIWFTYLTLIVHFTYHIGALSSLKLQTVAHVFLHRWFAPFTSFRTPTGPPESRYNWGGRSFSAQQWHMTHGRVMLECTDQTAGFKIKHCPLNVLSVWHIQPVVPPWRCNFIDNTSCDVNVTLVFHP